jgi:hypothetical protein
MNEPELREGLLDLASEAPQVGTIPRALVRRAHRRVALTVASSVVVAVVLVAGGIRAARSLDGSGSRPAGRATHPTASATPLVSGQRLQPGNYELILGSLAPLRVTFPVPSGWLGHDTGVVSRGGEPPAGSGLHFWTVRNLYVDPCKIGRGLLDPPLGPTVDDLANAFATQPRLGGTIPTGVTLDGYTGQHIVLTAHARAGFADCDAFAFDMWAFPGGGVRRAVAPGQRDELWILDVDGVRLVVDLSTLPGTPAEDRAALERMVRSVRVVRAKPST